MIKHGYITQERMNSANTFAIVRNPYSRMFSIFKYNRYGSLESFDHFVREWVSSPEVLHSCATKNLLSMCGGKNTKGLAQKNGIRIAMFYQ